MRTPAEGRSFLIIYIKTLSIFLSVISYKEDFERIGKKKKQPQIINVCLSFKS